MTQRIYLELTGSGLNMFSSFQKMNKRNNGFEAWPACGLCRASALQQRSCRAIGVISVWLSVCGVLDKIAHQFWATQ